MGDSRRQCGRGNNHVDVCMQNLELTLKRTECELETAIKKVRCLDIEKQNVAEELNDCRRDNQSLQQKLSSLCKERDGLLEKLDRKTVELCALTKENGDKSNRINYLEQSMSQLTCEFKSLEHEIQRAEQKIAGLKKELKECIDCKEKLMGESRKLQTELQACCNDNEFKDNEIRCLKEEMNCVKGRLCECCDEVKRLECCLEEKERENMMLREEINKLQAELMEIEQSKECAAQDAKSTNAKLSMAEDKCKNLESCVAGKDSQCQQMDQELCTMKREINDLKRETNCLCQKNIRLKHELDVAYDMCNTLEHQKQQCCSQLHEMEEVQKKLNYEICHAQSLIEQLKSQLQTERKNVNALENLITETRKESMEEKMENHNLVKKIKELESNIERLCSKLGCMKESLCKADKCRNELEAENTRLKRELAESKYQNGN